MKFYCEKDVDILKRTLVWLHKFPWTTTEDVEEATQAALETFSFAEPVEIVGLTPVPHKPLQDVEKSIMELTPNSAVDAFKVNEAAKNGLNQNVAEQLQATIERLRGHIDPFRGKSDPL